MKYRYPYKQNKLEYNIFIIVFLLSASVYLTKYKFLLALSLLLFYSIFVWKKRNINKDVLYISLAITILNLANYFIYNFFSLDTFIGNYVRFLMPYFAIILIGYKIPFIYINVIKIFTIISFVFYIPANIFPGFNELLQNIPQILGTDSLEKNHFIIYQVEYDRPWEGLLPIFRNSGPTGEPGEFAGYLIVAMILEFIVNRYFWTKNNRLFVIAIISTFSTAGYIALFIFLLSYSVYNKRVQVRFILVPLLISISLYTYLSFDFLHYKIDQQLSLVTQSREIKNIPRIGRLPNLVRNFDDSLEQPLFGKGRNFETRFDNLYLLDERAFYNNLFTFPVQFGWPFFIFYSYLLFMGFKQLLIYYNVDTRFAWISVLIIYTLAIGQGFLLFPAFVILIYLRNIFPKP